MIDCPCLKTRGLEVLIGYKRDYQFGCELVRQLSYKTIVFPVIAEKTAAMFQKLFEGYLTFDPAITSDTSTCMNHRDGYRASEPVIPLTDAFIALMMLKDRLMDQGKRQNMFWPLQALSSTLYASRLQLLGLPLLESQNWKLASTVNRSSGKEPGSFRSVHLIAVCPIVSSHLCFHLFALGRQASYRLPLAIDIPK
jgi:hypothetical protein